jgi:pyruvate formate lyase activating enzyme
LVGRSLNVAEVLAEILKDREFYEISGGGVTLSGGEPLLQAEGCRELLAECRRAGIATAVDTAGNVPWQAFELLLPVTELFLFDLKTMDSDLHRSACGSGNELILGNLRRLGTSTVRLIVRIPVIPGYNDHKDDVARVAGLLRELPNVEKAELLPYHKLGLGKYRALGLAYRGGALPTFDPESAKLAALRRELEDINNRSRG